MKRGEVSRAVLDVGIPLGRVWGGAVGGGGGVFASSAETYPSVTIFKAVDVI